MRRRLLCVILMANLLAAVLAVPPADATPECFQHQKVTANAQWSIVRAPHFQSPLIPAAYPGIRNYVVDPFQPDTIYVASSAEVFKSTDGGCEWNKIFPTPADNFVDCHYEEGLILYGCEDIYSIDIGTTLETHNRVYIQTMHSELPPSVSSIYFNDNGGDSWDLLEPSTTPDDVVYGFGPMTIAPSDPDTIYVERRDVAQHIYVSHDAGRTWEMMSPVTELPSFSGEFDVNPNDPKELWASGSLQSGTAMKLFRSRDEGRSWELIETPADVHYFDLVARPKGGIAIAVAGSYESFVSSDGGSSWESVVNLQETGSNESWVDIAFDRSGRYVFALGDADLTFRKDLRRRAVTTLKSASITEFSGDLDNGSTDNQRNALVITHSGLYFQAGCWGLNFACSALVRFRGEGAH